MTRMNILYTQFSINEVCKVSFVPYCGNCGNKVDETMAFCPKCGASLKMETTGQVGPTATSTANSATSTATMPTATSPAVNSLLEANEFVMKKKILSLHEHYDFEDSTGTKMGEADGNLFQVPAKFAVMDAHGSEVMHLDGKVISLRKQFTFYGATGEELGTIKKKIAKLIGEEFWVEKDGVEFMRIYGNFSDHNYRMEVNKVPVASIYKKWVSVRDTLGVSITGDVDHRVVMGAVIVIEHLEVTEKNSGNSSNFGNFGNIRFGFP